MQTIKTIALAMVLAVSSMASSFATDLTMSFYYAAGGSTEKFASSLVPSLERQGITVKKEFYKSCAEAMQAIDRSPDNNVLATLTGDISFANRARGLRCPPTDKMADELVPLPGVTRGAMGVCTRPDFAPRTIADLEEYSKKGNVVKIAYIPNDIFLSMLYKFTLQYTDINFILLPYSGGSTMRTATAAGDVDMFFSMTLAAELQPIGSTCIAMSAKTPGKLFMGEHSRTAFPSFYQSNFFVAEKGHISKDVLRALNVAYQSKEYASGSKVLDTEYEALSSEEIMTQIIQYEGVFSPIK